MIPRRVGRLSAIPQDALVTDEILMRGPIDRVVDVCKLPGPL
jgi:hypothetical protein